MPDLFAEKAFDIEHALVLYAKSYATMPAFGIYDDDQLAPLREQIADCHIYLIGLTPKVNIVDVHQEGADVVTALELRGKRYDLRWPLPAGTVLRGDAETGWYGEDEQGNRSFPDEATISLRLSRASGALDFKVLYIGQAFGLDGSRNALDRLKKHETLQKIAVQGIPDGFNLTLLMLAIEPGNQLITVMNPRALDKSQGAERIRAGLDKLFGTDEAERTTLYEASLIRYFQPAFNKVFKDSFPSTNLKVLADCYEKDFSAVVAEINIEELPFVLFSDAVAHKTAHIAGHDLHTDSARKMFFF